jgi:hypothetical protein
MSASVGTPYIVTDALPARGYRLMPCLHESHAPDNAVRQRSNVFPVPRSMSPRMTSRASMFSQLLRHWGGDRHKCVSAPFPIRHLAPPPGRFFVADRNVLEEVLRGPTKGLPRKNNVG